MECAQPVGMSGQFRIASRPNSPSDPQLLAMMEVLNPLDDEHLVGLECDAELYSETRILSMRILKVLREAEIAAVELQLFES